MSAIHEVVERLKYKPRWEFEILPPSHKDAYLYDSDGYLRIIWHAIDTYHPEQMTRVMLQHVIPPELDYHRAVQWLFYMIMKAEQHEVEEFFEIDGVKLFDPHVQRGPFPDPLAAPKAIT